MSAEGLDWSEEEQAFARACQAAMGLPEKGMATSGAAGAGRDQGRRIDRCRRHQLGRADRPVRLALASAGCQPAYLAGDGLRRHVDRRQGVACHRTDPGRCRPRPDDPTRTAGGGQGGLPARKGDTMFAPASRPTRSRRSFPPTCTRRRATTLSHRSKLQGDDPIGAKTCQPTCLLLERTAVDLNDRSGAQSCRLLPMSNGSHPIAKAFEVTLCVTPSLLVLERIAKALKVDVSEFFKVV